MKKREERAKKPKKAGTGKTRKPKTNKHKALVLLSGGLDSRLVVKMLEGQLGKSSVEAVFFALPFGGGCCSDRFCVLKFTSIQGIKLHVIDCTRGSMLKRYMNIVKKPRFSRGVAMNPCIDCHLFMLKEAKSLSRKIGADIIATGEVLGERPLSQNKGALKLIEREAGLEGRVLKPLSAKLLPETDAERNGWIDRSSMLDIQGRRRVRQIALAKKYKITYPTPGGGCVLTDKMFSKRLIGLLEYKQDKQPGAAEIELLKLGRHFRYGGGRSPKSRKTGNSSIIVVGRNEKENGMLTALAKRIRPRPAAMSVIGHMGPVTLVLGGSRPAMQAAARLTVRYSDAPARKAAKVEITKGKKKSVLSARALPKREIEKLRV